MVAAPVQRHVESEGQEAHAADLPRAEQAAGAMIAGVQPRPRPRDFLVVKNRRASVQLRGILASRCCACHFCQSSRVLLVRVTSLGTRAITGALSVGSSASASSN